MRNMNIDLHRVAKVVEDQVLEISKAIKRANDAMDQANKATDNSNVNKTAIKSANEAIAEAKSSANDALTQIKSLASNDAVKKIKQSLDDALKKINESFKNTDADIGEVKKTQIEHLKKIVDAQKDATDALEKIKSLASNSAVQDIKKTLDSTNADIAKIKKSQANQISDVTNKISDAVAQAKAAADSLSARTDDLQTAIKNAQGDATVAKQTAQQASATAIDAKGDATVAMQTAKQVTVDMKNAEKDVLAAKATANQASITAGNAASDAATAKITASGASVVATNAKNDVTKMSATVDGISTDVASINKKVTDLGSEVTQNQTAISQNKDAIALKANQATVDGIGKRVSKNEAQLKVQADKIDSKVSGTEMSDAIGKAQSNLQSKIDKNADSIKHNETEISQAKDEIALKADQKSVDGINNRVTQNTAQLKVQAGQINSKVNATDVKKAVDKAQGDLKALIDKNTTAIDQNAKSITLKADQTAVDAISKTASQHSATLTTLSDEIKSKVDSTTVKGLIDSKGFTTANTVQSLIDQKADKISQTITDVKSNVDKNGKAINSANDRVSTLTHTIDGLKATVSDNHKNINNVQVKATGLEATLATQGKDIATIKANASGLSSRVSGVEKSSNVLADKLKNLKIGTRNLLHHSDTFEGWQKGNAVKVSDASKYLSGKVTTLPPDKNANNRLWAQLDGPYDDEPVTWTVYAKADNKGDKLHSELWGGGGSNDQPLTTDWKEYKFSGKRNKQHHELFFWGYQGNKGNVYVALPFAVVGNEIGSWNSNPDDVANGIAANTTAIDQNKRIISLKADQSAVNNLAGKVSQNAAQLKVQADQISSKVSSTDVTSMVSKAQSALQSGINKNASAINQASKQISGKADQSTVSDLQSKIDKNTTAINQASKSITLKADQTTVDALNKLASQHSASLTTLSNEIKSKVDSTTVNNIINGKGFTTTNTVQSLIDQKANKISQTITNVQSNVDKNGKAINTTNNQLSNLTQTIDGIQTSIRNKADKSQITQLSNQITAKVSVKDYQSEIALLNKNLNLRVKKGDVISQINQEAGGPTLIQVAGGKGKLLLDADSVVFKNRAFIPSAAIIDIAADKITSGTLDAGNIRVINLTADNIHGGTLDVGNMHVKNFSANDIETGTLSGIDIVSIGDHVVDENTDKNYPYIKINDGTIYLGEIAKRDESLINTDRTIPYNDEPLKRSWISAQQNCVEFVSDNLEVLGANRHQGSFMGTFQPRLHVGEGDTWDTPSILLGLRRFGGPEGHFESQVGLRMWQEMISLDLDGVEKAESSFSIQKNDHIGAYFGTGNNGNEINFVAAGNGSGINFNAPLTVTNSLNVTGAKHSIVNTSQGYVGINAYETAEYYFGDVGESNTGDNCQVVIGIDKIFNETVNTDVQYQVFITPYSDCRVWVEQRYDNRFVVRSDKPNAEFGWEIKAKRKGYENYRLRHIDGIKEKGEIKV